MKAIEVIDVEEQGIPPVGSGLTSASSASDEAEHVASRPLKHTPNKSNTRKEAIKNTTIDENSSKKSVSLKDAGYTGEFELLSDHENATNAAHESL